MMFKKRVAATLLAATIMLGAGSISGLGTAQAHDAHCTKEAAAVAAAQVSLDLSVGHTARVKAQIALDAAVAALDACKKH